MSDERVDVAVIGGGVVGCAVACALADGTRSVMLLEAGPRVAEGVTSRNSGVVHSGLYYPPGSLKAQTCVRGNALLYEWADAHGVGVRRTGKLVVAVTQSQEAALDALLDNARRSGAAGVVRVARRDIVSREPDLAGRAALWCPDSGIVDPTELTRSFLFEAESRGAVGLTGARVEGIASVPRGWALETTRGPLVAERVVNAAGLYADEVAAMAGIDRYRIYPCRGDYFRLTTSRRYRHLIYPVKEPASPGLGVHLTIGLDGAYRLGPDVSWVERKDDFAPAEHKHAAFLQAAERLLGPVEPHRLHYDFCGIRPKLRAPHEPQERDFVVAEDRPGFVSLVGIESPGLTSAIALAERVVRLVG